MKNDPNAPIGLFDSGVGGLTVARALVELLPQERLLYFADTAHVPYGPRPLEELKQLAFDITEFLQLEGAKAVIMGSNSSDAAALTAAKEKFGPLIFGVIQPGARAALRAARVGKCIGILATQATVSTRAYSNALHSLDGAVEVIEQACPEFVPLVESGQLNTPPTREVAREYLAPVLGFGAKVIVLGCTQYPLLAPLIQEIVGPEVALVDPAEEVAKEVGAALEKAGLLSAESRGINHRFFASGDDTSLKEVGAWFFGKPIEQVEKADIWKN